MCQYYYSEQTATSGTPCPILLVNSVWVLSHPTECMNIEGLQDRAYGLSSLFKKTRESNHLDMSLQRQHFLLSYLKTISVGLEGF